MRKGLSEKENTFYCHLFALVEEKVFFLPKESEREKHV